MPAFWYFFLSRILNYYLHNAYALVYIRQQILNCVLIYARERKVKDMMKKAALAVSLLAGLGLGVGGVSNVKPQSKSPERNSVIIVEIDRTLDSLTDEGVNNVQKMMYESIKANVTSNISLVSSYTVLNNAIAISINDGYIEAVKSLPGVKSVTLNKAHFVTSQSHGSKASRNGDSSEVDPSTNISAETMKKGTDTADGEGTVIAVLDNEFFFRGQTSDAESWGHVAFTELDSTTKVRYEGRPKEYTLTHAYKDEYEDANGKKHSRKAEIDGATLGHEGSLYYNSKVPFYFDYGGDKESHGGDAQTDYDVSSKSSYHGSHVASTAAGNDPDYKGIAPKAQLVCMKVFTNIKAGEIDNLIGYGDSTGAYDVPILNALEDAISLKVDGINMSLGSNLDDFDQESITLKTLTRLNEVYGIMSSISAGNSGKASYKNLGGYANWTGEMVETGILGSYANSAASTIVASGQPTHTYFASAFKMANEAVVAYDDQVVNRMRNDYEEEHKMYDLVEDKTDKTLPWIYVGGFGQSSDYKGKNVDGKVAVVNRGKTAFSEKYELAFDAGAIALVVINNDPTATDFQFSFSFGDVQPKIPVVSALFGDKGEFGVAGSEGTFEVIKDKTFENVKALTSSTFTTDGVAFNLELKPDITTPGDFIKGAVPPQEKEDKQDPERMYKVYEFLSGTSMAAPNYAGAQSVVYSKAVSEALKTKKYSELTTAEINKLKAFRSTVDMRLLSTAEPMNDYDRWHCEECGYDWDGSKLNADHKCLECGHSCAKVDVLTSPRIQGAGMVNLGAAYATDVYLEGVDAAGKGTGKAKVALKNEAAINKGDVQISFIAHNESQETRNYTGKLTIMRPAVVKSNEYISKEYNNRGEIDSLAAFPGTYTYVAVPHLDEPDTYEKQVTSGSFAKGDVFKVTKDIEYYATPEACQAKVYDGKWEAGIYVNNGDDKTANWEILEGKDYQSNKDAVIAEVNLGTIAMEKGNNTITLDKYSLTAEQKTEISNFFDYGCYLEGYVSFDAQGSYPDLNLVWNGFYAGEGKSIDNAPVVEPFGFEKDQTGQTVYPSDLVNDVTKTLIGKANVDFGSTIATGYIAPGKGFNSDSILANDESLTHLASVNANWSILGYDQSSKQYLPDAANKLYAGAREKSNNLLIQQFVLRSVKDNYITLTNKKDGKVYGREVLQDMMFGGYMETFPLYKSHIDDSYLGAGYVSHRAWGIIPLYNTHTGEAYPTGDYDLTFNYQLATNGHWVSKTYLLHIDTDAPEVTKVSQSGDNVTIYTNEVNMDKLYLGQSAKEFQVNNKGQAYAEFTKDELVTAIDSNVNPLVGTGRVYLEMSDKAGAKVGAVLRFEENPNKEYGYNFAKFTVVQGSELTIRHDFQDNGNSITYFFVNGTAVTEYVPTGKIKVLRDTDLKAAKNGCGGNIATASIILASLSAIGIALLLINKKKHFLGGKK